MLFMKICKHFNVSLDGEIFVRLRSTDTINIQTLKRMKITKEHGQWVADTKGFDSISGPSKIPCEGDEDDDVPEAPPHDISGSNIPRSLGSGFTFTVDQYYMLNGRIDSLTSSVNSLDRMLHQMQTQ